MQVVGSERWTGLGTRNKIIEKNYYICLKAKISKNFLYFYHEVEVSKKMLYSIKTKVLVIKIFFIFSKIYSQKFIKQSKNDFTFS